MTNWDEYIGKQSNYGKIKSVWPQQSGFLLVNTEDGSQFCILKSTLKIKDDTMKPMIMRSDFTGVTVGYYDESPSSKGNLGYYRRVCRFEGDKDEAEKHATRFIVAYNEHFGFIKL